MAAPPGGGEDGAGPRPRVVVLRALGLGDLLTAVPALRALGRAMPNHERVLLCPRELAPLLSAAGAADVVLHTDFRTTPPHAGGLPRAAGRPSVAVNLHGRGPESHRAVLALEPDRVIAHAEPRSGIPGPPFPPERHEVDRWCDLLEWHGIPADPSDLHLDIPPARPALPGRDRCVVLHPGASSPARRWPAGRWVEVARALAVLGRPVVITGGPGEAELAGTIAHRAGLGPEHVLAGRTSVLDLARTVAGACALVSCDSGPAHLATAVGTPSVVLFGPTPPSRWGPRIDRRRHVCLWSGRTGDANGSTPHPGLLEITSADVLAALRAAGP